MSSVLVSFERHESIYYKFYRNIAGVAKTAADNWPVTWRGGDKIKIFVSLYHITDYGIV